MLDSINRTRKEISDRLPGFLFQAQAAERKYKTSGDPDAKETALEFYRMAALYDPGNQTALGGIERLSDGWDL